MMRLLSTGAPACFTMTVVDGIVLARSAFEHSANYESVVAFGTFEEVSGKAERLEALAAFTNKLLPGRWNEVRQPNERELKATMVLGMAISEASAKVRSGPPDDDGSEDAALDVWAGVLPIHHILQEPVASPGLRNDIPISESVRRRIS
jgi:nitroimidazol reductase NimA-like FMN-containing flavoprotein (pyridoxamine 5'-phosphate oxidase superfamily)